MITVMCWSVHELRALFDVPLEVLLVELETIELRELENGLFGVRVSMLDSILMTKNIQYSVSEINKTLL